MKPTSIWRSLRRSVAVIAAAGVATLTLSLPATATDRQVNPGTIDDSRTASLQVHKFEQPVERGERGNGTEQSTGGLTALRGIEFQVKQVPGVDLTTNAGWQQAADLADGDIEDVIALTDGVTPTSKTTDGSGLASFDGLPLGLYVVTENLTAEQMTSGITGSAPFLVTLPMTHPTDLSTWMYTVHVYPKNNVDSITKTVQDENATKLGDTVNWTIQGSIPAGGPTSKYVITDQLDDRLAYTGAAVSIAPASAGTLAAGTHYDVTHENGLVTITFTEAGRTALDSIKKANASAKVQVVISTTVESLGAETEDGALTEIENQAILFPNDSNVNGIPSEKPKTTWGGIDIKKVDETGEALAGATFQVFATEADAKSGSNPISIKGKADWTSNDAGLIHIDGLRPGDYWVAESKAPTGYSLLAEPQEVTVSDNSRSTIELEVENVPSNSNFELPFTGGAGIWYLILAGAGILLIAGGVYLRVRFADKGRATA